MTTWFYLSPIGIIMLLCKNILYGFLYGDMYINYVFSLLSQAFLCLLTISHCTGPAPMLAGNDI